METQTEMTPKKNGMSNGSSSERVEAQFSSCETFGLAVQYKRNAQGEPLLDANGNKVVKDAPVKGYSKPGPETPKIDPGYVFPEEATRLALLALTTKDRVLITGETGTGKSSLVEQIAARLNYNLVKINFDGAITRTDLLGTHAIIPNPNGNGSITTFQHGILPYAFRLPGTMIVLDEWDTISDECAFVLQRPLQREDGKLLLLENGGEIVELHPSNTIFATANTAGSGDETGRYLGTRHKNYAFVNRFGLTIKMDYLPVEQEVKMVMHKFPTLKQNEADALVGAVNKFREGSKTGEFSGPLSTRDLLNWTEKYVYMGNILRSAKACFLNRMNSAESALGEEILKRYFNT